MNKCRVIYSSGGNYKVLCNKQIFPCKPRGLFRKDNQKIIVGDIVDIELSKAKHELNIITKLHPRTNEFERPNISNIDYAIVLVQLWNLN